MSKVKIEVRKFQKEIEKSVLERNKYHNWQKLKAVRNGSSMDSLLSIDEDNSGISKLRKKSLPYKSTGNLYKSVDSSETESIQTKCNKVLRDSAIEEDPIEASTPSVQSLKAMFDSGNTTDTSCSTAYQPPRLSPTLELAKPKESKLISKLKNPKKEVRHVLSIVFEC